MSHSLLEIGQEFRNVWQLFVRVMVVCAQRQLSIVVDWTKGKLEEFAEPQLVKRHHLNRLNRIPIAICRFQPLELCMQIDVLQDLCRPV